MLTCSWEWEQINSLIKVREEERVKTKCLPERGQLAFARDCKTIVTLEDVLNLLPEQLDVEDVQKALEDLDVPYWPEEIKARLRGWPYFSNPFIFLFDSQKVGRIKRVYDEDGLHIGFEKRE